MPFDSLGIKEINLTSMPTNKQVQFNDTPSYDTDSIKRKPDWLSVKDDTFEPEDKYFLFPVLAFAFGPHSRDIHRNWSCSICLWNCS